MPPRAEPGSGKKTVQAHSSGAAGLNVRLGFREADDLLAFLELAALLQKLDAFETLQDVPLGRDGAGSLETAMLRHKMLLFFRGWRAGTLARSAGFSTPAMLREKFEDALLIRLANAPLGDQPGDGLAGRDVEAEIWRRTVFGSHAEFHVHAGVQAIGMADFL